MSLSASEDVVAHCGTVCLVLIAFVQWLAFDIFYVKVFASQIWWFATLPRRTRLFISDCVNWEEGPFAKAAFCVSSSRAFLLQKSPPFFFLISSFLGFLLKSSLWTWWCPSGARASLVKKKKRHPLSLSASLFNSSSLSQTRSQLAFYRTLILWIVISVLSGKILPFLVNCFDCPRPFATSQSLNHAHQIKCPLLLVIRVFGKEMPQIVPFSTFHRKAINCRCRQDTFVSIKHKTPRTSFLSVWGSKLTADICGSAAARCSSLHIFNILHMNGN